MSSRTILKRLGELEEAFRIIDPEDKWIDVVMWDIPGGIFGHAHHLFRKSDGETVRKPCTDEEELEIMRAYYEDEGHRLYGKGDEVSFAEYLERSSYLCPEALVERLKLVIERVSDEENLA